MSLKENEYRQNYECKENYAGEKQKQLRHGKYIIWQLIVNVLCNDVI